MRDLTEPVDWQVLISHPASRTEYQEAETSRGTVARVTEDGHEVVSPSGDTEQVRRQYNGRVQAYLKSYGL